MTPQAAAHAYENLVDAIFAYVGEHDDRVLARRDADDYAADGRVIGEEAFLTVDAADRDAFVEAAVDEELAGIAPNEAESRIMLWAAEYQLQWMIADQSRAATVVKAGLHMGAGA